MHQFLKSSCLALALCVAPALPASADYAAQRCYYDCNVGPRIEASTENGPGHVSYDGADWYGDIVDGTANGYGLWTEIQGATTHNFHGEAKDGHPTGPGLMSVEGWPVSHFGDFKTSNDAVIPASLDNPAYLLEVMQGSDTPPRKVATAADLSPTHAVLYTNGMTAAIKAFDAEEKAREAMKGQ
ncbi:MAG: hypothetical protein KJ871_14700 [Alphaproteobacteria bacterium]|nr:hypothetical protein [Alphaproteobacteria bacterium]MBU2084536.1 hypothetical protein [Alphaproteobacteria bacterium]MBU2142729.1 hypothetical protein [Alphaproteobacteria bacterium]MBU2197477.1 hypothetical protein [Alphaproteobacteria bacterium]